MPSLTELFQNATLSPLAPSALPKTSISHLTADSREVKAGTLFVAVPGTVANGEDFAPQAVEKGAVCVVAEKELSLSVPTIVVENARLALALLARAISGKQPDHVVAVTGTDGKTSTAEFFRQLAERSGCMAAAIGTLGTLGKDRKEVAPGVRTTPDPVKLMEVLHDLRNQGYTHVAMEASSHGLHQYRLDGVHLTAAAFTNLTRDHLDYHKTEEAYFEAKLRLFSELLPEGGTAVINADDKRAGTLREVAKKRGHTLVDFGKSAEKLKILSHRPLPTGQQVELELMSTKETYTLQHVGLFQVYNMLAAAGLYLATGGKLEDILKHLPHLSGVPGRLQRIAVLENGATVYIDYAHTDAALANVLKTLRDHTDKKLNVVFGCGGDRDRGKRPLMGKAACELADLAYVTDDNPRSEDPAFIRSEVMVGCPSAKEVAGRRDAIYGAMQELEAGDILLVAGKGHETGQTIGDKTLPFDDAEVIREAVRDMGQENRSTG